MKILLVNPPNSGRDIAQEVYGYEPTQKIFKGEPFSLETLAGALKNHHVKILDLKAEQASLSEEIISFGPDLIGFTAQTCEANTVLGLCIEAKETYPYVLTVVGGIHASCMPEFFNRPSIDFVVMGLGKKSFAELVDAIENKQDTNIPGIAQITPGKDISYEKRRYSKDDLLEDLPPRYDLVSMYRKHYSIESLGLDMGYVVSAFGCTNGCAFCCISNLTDRRYIPCNLSSVVRDIKLLGDIPVIRFVDANTFANINRATALCQAIEKEGINKRFIIDACADTVASHPDLFRRWRDIGLSAVVIGFEEIDDRRLASWNKKNTLQIVSKAIEFLHGLDITIVGDFIVSPEYEEKDFSVLENFVVSSSIKIPLFSVLTPLPGTPLYYKMKDRIVITDLDYYTLTNAVVPTRLPEKDFYGLLTQLQKRFGDRAGL